MRNLLLSVLLLPVCAQAEPALPAGADPALDALLDRQTRMFRVLHSAPFGIGIDVQYRDQAALTAIETFLAQPSDDFQAVTGQHPFEVLENYSGPSGIGLRGGGAVPAVAYRYLVLKREGAAADVLAAARRDVVRALDTLHVVVAITGEPGRVARGVQRLKPEDPSDPPIPLGDHRDTVPLFDDQGNPLPPEKNNGTPRDDNSKGALPPGEWMWEDSCSRDQLVGWVFAMTSLYDAAKDDPDIDQALVARLQADAAAVAAMLREKHPMVTLTGEVHEYDLIIMDADGRPTQHHDIHPSGLDGIWLPPEAGPNNMFNLVMALGILKGLHHVAGDLEAERFLYEELLWRRGYLDLVPGPEGDDFLYLGAKTNFSSVNMIAISIFLALHYETDPEVRKPLADYLEHVFWDKVGEPRAARRLKQPYFHAIYLLNTDHGTDPALVAEAGTLLKQFPLGPYTLAPRINCDEAELEAGTCLAVDGKTTLTLDDELSRGDHPIATEALSPSIRPPSNFNARTDPFIVNLGDDPRGLAPAGDLVSAYWMLRWLELQPAGTAPRSAHARAHIPVAEYVEPPLEADPDPTPPDVGPEEPVVAEPSEPVTDLGAPAPTPEAGGGCAAAPRAPAGWPALLLIIGLVAIARWRPHEG